MKRLVFCAAVALCAASSLGQTFTGGTRLTFSSPSGPGVGWIPYTTISNAAGHGAGQTSVFTTGDPAPGFPPVLPNSLTTVGQDFAVDAEDQFVVASLEYFNGRTFAGTSAEQVTGTASLLFSAPPMGGPNPISFDYNFSFLFTPNTPGDVDDELTISLLGSPQVFTVGDVTYTLTLLGFRLADNTFTTTFLLPEGQTAYADLIGTITTNIIPLPSGAGLAFAGLIGIAAYRRRA